MANQSFVTTYAIKYSMDPVAAARHILKQIEGVDLGQMSDAQLVNLFYTFIMEDRMRASIERVSQ